MSSSRFHGVFGTMGKGWGVRVKGEKEESLEEVPDAEREDAPSTAGQLALDIYEDNGYLIIKVPLAAVKLADLDIDIAENVVTVRGKREQCDTVSEEQYFLQECYWGEFRRSVKLPFAPNPARVKATFSKDNILKIFIPKEERRVKIVKINEGG